MRALATVAVLALAPLALAGCHKADKGPKTLEQAKEEARQLQRPEPGLYQQTTKITKFEVPGAPPQMAEQIKAMMQGQGQQATFCLTKEDSEKGFEGMFKQVAQGECSYDRFDATSGTIDAVMTCKTGTGGTAHLAINGKVSKSGSAVKVNVEQSGEKSAAGNAQIAMEVSSKRLGDCDPAQASGQLPGMAPGAPGMGPGMGPGTTPGTGPGVAPSPR
jgi:hypothetical protein